MASSVHSNKMAGWSWRIWVGSIAHIFKQHSNVFNKLMFSSRLLGRAFINKIPTTISFAGSIPLRRALGHIAYLRTPIYSFHIHTFHLFFHGSFQYLVNTQTYINYRQSIKLLFRSNSTRSASRRMNI